MTINSIGNISDGNRSSFKIVQEDKAEHHPSKDEVSISGQDVSKKKWTFLHYGAGDNNLSHFIYSDVDEMESVGSDGNTNLISQLDLSSGSCKRYYLQKDYKPGVITSPVVMDLGERVNMASPQTLTDFIVWGVKNYPSEYVALSIGDHGGGTSGAIADDRDGGYAMMKPEAIEKAIKDAEKITGKKLDILAFDCCLMANTEVAYQLRDVARYMVASEETEGGNGWPYNKVLSEKVLSELQQDLANKIDVRPEDLIEKIMKEASSVQEDLPTMSAVDLSKMKEVGEKLDSFAIAILNTKTSMSTLRGIVSKTQSFSGFKDIYDFAQKVFLSEKIKDENLKKSAKELMNALKHAIVAETHSNDYPGAHGLQIELKTWGWPSSAYDTLDIGKDTHWDEAISKIALP